MWLTLYILTSTSFLCLMYRYYSYYGLKVGIASLFIGWIFFMISILADGIKGLL
jgi:hypothetical protein